MRDGVRQGDGESGMGGEHFLPVQRQAAVERARIVERALDGDPALILLHGGGGTGKSLAASQIARAFLTARPDADAVWVRLAEEDAGREGFWQRILFVLSEAGVLQAGSVAARLAEGGVASAPRELGRVFAAVPLPLLLVLDDAHRAIDAETEESLIDVLEHAAGLTIAVTSRRLLARLSSVHARTRVAVRVLDDATLALSEEEVRTLLTMRLPVVDDGEAAAIASSIHRASRGWPLAAHALVVERELLADRAVPSRGRHQAHGAFVRELVSRLLQSVDERTRIALCLLGLLDEVSPAVLAEALEVSEGEAGVLLERAIETSSGFRTADAGTSWYRLHDLLRSELRERAPALLGVDRLRRLAGRTVGPLRTVRPRLALEAAVLGQEWEQLSELLVEGSTITIARRLPHTRLADVPEDVRNRYPVIAAFALIDEYAYPDGRFGRVMVGLRLLAGRALAAESAKTGLPGLTAAVLRTVAARLSGNESVAVRMAERVREVLQQLDHEEIERYRRPLQTGINQTAITLLHAGRLVEAILVLEPMLEHQDRLLPKPRAHAVALAAWTAAWGGRMGFARELLEGARMLELPLGWRNSYIGAGYRIAGALDALERDEPGAAKEELAALAEHESTIEHWPFLVCVEALAVESLHGPAAAAEHLARQAARRRGRSTALPSAKREIAALRARLLWHAGRVLPAPRHGRGDLSAVYAAMSRGDYALASALAAGVEHDAHGNLRHLVQALLVQAECGRQGGDDRVAAANASRAVALMHEHQLDVPMRVLPRAAALGLRELEPRLPVERSAPAAVRTAQPLTPAERRALLSVAEHGSVAAAAASSYLSAETVKGYLKQVYRKLGVNSRSDAIRVAAQAGLLHDPSEPDPTELAWGASEARDDD